MKKSKDNHLEQVKKNTFNKAGEPASTINARIREIKNAVLIVFSA